ncbi:MAG: hypothetical protein GY866_36790 [Proteobacteria bacterium]|nr:hypothetical protein [Pseudomonadota bacterium]
MNWTTIDQELCNQCEICKLRCVRNYQEKDGEIISVASQETCNLCGHCVALCPTEAITHHQMDMDNFSPLRSGINVDTDDFVHFIRGRRSHRRFIDKEIPQKNLETLIDLCRYAPTGSNRQTTEIMVVRDREKINRLSNHTVDFFENKKDWLVKEVEEYKAMGKEPPQVFTSALTMLDTLDMIVLARKFGFEVIFHQAPVVMIFHSPTETSSPKDDCVIASTTVTMAARTMDLETCYIGLFEFVANTNQPIVEELNLPAGNKVFSVLILGYPEFEFYRTVDRKPMQVQWE